MSPARVLSADAIEFEAILEQRSEAERAAFLWLMKAMLAAPHVSPGSLIAKLVDAPELAPIAHALREEGCK